ncbi:MAG: glycosyltransferase [Burkholderiales bacterium]|nr:glycosyltransferase [Phycisphaerae bacterium]
MDHLGEWVLAILYLLLGPGAWALYWFGMIIGRARMRIRPDPLPTLDRCPRASVIIPCKDEAAHISTCVASVLAQDWPALELIVINDRSTDRTGEVLDRIAAQDARVRIIHVPPDGLPPGWWGKTHAMHLGSKVATGEWMVFIDSDCVLAPPAVRTGITTGIVREFDLVSFTPKFVSTSFWDQMITPLGGVATSAMYQLMFANSAMVPKVAFACGQYMAVRRDVFNEVGGWEAIHHLPADDVEIARLFKRSGKRPRIGWGMDLVTTTMYADFRGVWRGWSRNFIAAARGGCGRVLWAAAFLLFCVWSIYPAVAWGIYRQNHPINAFGGIGWLVSAGAHAVLMTAGLWSAYRWGGNNPLYALLWPFSTVVLLAIFCRSVYMSLTGRMDWRGVSYTLPSAAAKASNS